MNHSTQKWVDNGHNGCLYLSGRVCYLEWDYWRESSDYDRNMSVACAYSQTDTSTCKNTKLYTYFFILCRKKLIPKMSLEKLEIYPKTYSFLFTPFLNVIFISFHIHPNTTQLNEQNQTLYIFVNQITQATCLLMLKRRVMFEQTSTILNLGREVSTPHIIKGSNCRSNKNP